MAKQLVNPLERHVEKLVLALAALVLIGVLVKFVFSSPNKVELGNESTTPSTIDSRLSQKANEILLVIQGAKPQVVEHEPKVDEFAASIEPIKAGDLPIAASIGPELPMVDAPDVASGLAKLVTIPAPTAPKFTHGRNTLLLATAQGDSRTPADWVMLAIPFDVKAQSDLQRRAWGATKADVIFATPEIQRRMRHADGTWSDGDWQTINAWPSHKMPTPPTIRLMDQGGKIEANKEDQRAAEKYQEDMLLPQVQLAVLRPLPPTFTKDENPWKFPLVTTYEAVVKQDQEFLLPNDPSAATEDRYNLKQADAASKPKTEAKTPAQVLSQELDDARVQMEQGRKLWEFNEVMRAYNRAIEVFGNKDATADLKNKAQKLMKEAELLSEDVKRNPNKAKSASTPTKPGDEVPKRDKLHQQDIWAYDATAGSIENGQTYQYRMRVRVLNRLAGHPGSFEKPTDAQTVIVPGEWSEPTEAIHIPEDSWFFVTREDKNKREVGVEFFRWYDGVWVKPKSSAKFNEGQTLTFQDTIQVPGLEVRAEPATTTVDFSEDLTLLDIEFARPFRERKSGSTASGVKFSPQPAPATAAVFVDGKGGLHERIVTVDKDNPQKKKIETWSPAKRASVP